MFQIACTRFNNFTFQENINFRKKNNINVIYGATLKIREKYGPGTLIFVAEMNNETNKIEGIGLIKNLLVHDTKYKIYENNEYNRYIYKGKYWLSRSQINNFDYEILEIFDNILFKGKSHLKFRTGITIITENLFVHWIYEYSNLKNKIKELFLFYFKTNIKEENLDEELIEKQKEEEYFEIIPKKRKRIGNNNI
jgi:hypothetical protein